jgi:hypothetical protein
VREVLDLLEPRIRPAWLIPQYRHALDRHGDQGYDQEGQQQVLRPSFEGLWDSVRALLGTRLNKLTREFAASADMKVKKEIARLAREYGKLKERWLFVARRAQNRIAVNCVLKGPPTAPSNL